MHQRGKVLSLFTDSFFSIYICTLTNPLQTLLSEIQLINEGSTNVILNQFNTIIHVGFKSFLQLI